MAKAGKQSPNDSVSIWVWIGDMPPLDREIDTLKDLCGVDYYDVDFQEGVCDAGYPSLPIEELLRRLSYSGSFLTDAVEAAKKRNVKSSRWVVAQYRFAYDIRTATQPVADNPVFLGSFRFRNSSRRDA